MKSAMKPGIRLLPTFLVLAIAAAMFCYGPIAQLAHYHEFADTRNWLHVPNAADVLSNIGFAAAGLFGLYILWSRHRDLHLSATSSASLPGYFLFAFALLLTAIGSSYYHLAPDNDRLLWDRIPIALACAGLLAAMRAETHDAQQSVWVTILLAGSGIASVLWWSYTEQSGQGDLRPYLLLQLAPLLLIPLWQAIYQSSRQDRLRFAAVILLYGAAKITELSDHQLFGLLGWISGHTLKHLLATAAGALLIVHIAKRINIDDKTLQPSIAHQA